MSNTEAIQLISRLTEASVNHYRAVNERTRQSPEKAKAIEYAACRALLREILNRTPIDEEIEQALNW